MRSRSCLPGKCLIKISAAICKKNFINFGRVFIKGIEITSKNLCFIRIVIVKKHVKNK